MRTLPGFLLVFISLGAELRPAPEGAWVPLAHGLEARLRAGQASFDSSGKIEILVDVRNTGEMEAYLETLYDVMQLSLYQDGKEVRPELARLFGPKHRTIYSTDSRWVKPGQSSWFPATYEHGAFNLFSAYAAFSLSPGKYEVGASIRLSAGQRIGNGNLREGVIDLKPIVIEVTGKPLPPWPQLGGGKPIEGLEVPEATQKLSARLRALPPRDAVAALLDEYHKAQAALQGFRYEIEDNYIYVGQPLMRAAFSAGTGWLCERGPAANELKPVHWFDAAQKVEVRHYAGETTIQRHDKPNVRAINPSYDSDPVVFPLALIAYTQYGENWLCRRDGDLLVLAVSYSDQNLVWIDLRSLAVLSKTYHYKIDKPSCEVTRLEGYRYLDAFPFPVPRRQVTEYYSPPDQKEPSPVYTRTLRSVELRKSPLPELRLPPIPKQ
jgi:hypothetical protein